MGREHLPSDSLYFFASTGRETMQVCVGHSELNNESMFTHTHFPQREIQFSAESIEIVLFAGTNPSPVPSKTLAACSSRTKV